MATKDFDRQALNDNSTPRVIKSKVTSKGTLILPDDIPEDVKEWVKNG